MNYYGLSGKTAKLFTSSDGALMAYTLGKENRLAVVCVYIEGFQNCKAVGSCDCNIRMVIVWKCVY